MRQAIDFQSIMMTLQKYWGEKGCLIWQPYYTQVGAGTMNPATFLRVLGPEPWNVGYVEPSIRPDDGRYGDNPYRLQQHYQFQVILKPDPGNPQELYLGSLEALGIQPEEHDIRFVEDNWESPALSAWGLGWEVWLDGQEITQFTYFQQAGGINLEPVSVEITYGLERIAMALQGNYNFRNIQWNSDFTYGDVNYQAEKEHSIYYFEEADIERVRAMYQLFEQEAELALARGLVLPAHDYILKCSHAFNIMDTRGAVGVTERQALFKRMRELARRTAEAYIAQREELGFPWLQKPVRLEGKLPEKDVQAQMPLPSGELPQEPAELLLEIGTEELPAADVESAIRQLSQSGPAMLDALRLEYQNFKVLGTPRRLVILAKQVAARQPERVQKVKGPPADKAWDADGKLTQAALGFARSRGIEPEALRKEELDGGVYLTAEVRESGRHALEVLPEKMAGLVGAIKFEKSMRWNASGAAFSRPIRWLAALFGEQIIPFNSAGLVSGRITRGLRFSQNGQHEISGAQDYLDFLKKENILADPQERRQAIAAQVRDLLEAVGADTQLDESLLSEVTQLVETPTALLGNFDERHLELPEEVLIGVMKKHQRYFPVKKAGGGLLPHFITVRNGGKEHLDTVARGNEEVIQARFADAAFFMEEDSRQRLEEFVPKLEALVFHPKLGSMLDKTRRISKGVETLVGELGLGKADAKAAVLAARLCKADLATKMVVEMTSLQGVIGRHYALKDGVDPLAAQAIEEHYYPRFAGDSAPKSPAGLAVGLADRLDSLVGLFAVGMVPSGAKDPFGLRRAAIGLVQNLVAHSIRLDLRASLDASASLLPVEAAAESRQACLEFIIGRLENMLIEQGGRVDVVRAVLGEADADPCLAAKNVKELSEWTAREDWSTILPAFARCVRITRDLKEIYPLDTELFSTKEEKELHTAFRKVNRACEGDHSVGTFLEAFVSMIPAINRFFETVLVMDEDEAIRQNRLGLLQGIAGLARGRADFSLLEGF
jgi:glycyl-tRNA synthetase